MLSPNDQSSNKENVSEGNGQILTSRLYSTIDKSLSKSLTYTNKSNEVVNTQSSSLRKIDQKGNYSAYFSQTFIKDKQYTYGNKVNGNDKLIGRDIQEWTILIFQGIHAIQKQ